MAPALTAALDTIDGRRADLRSDTTLEELRSWLGHPLDARSWLVLLTPELTVPSWRCPDGTVEIVRSLRWDAPPDERASTVAHRVRWISTRPGSLELGIVSRCRDVDGDVIASTTEVLRTTGSIEDMGRRPSLRPPSIDVPGHVGELVVDAADITRFAALTTTSYAMHAAGAPDARPVVQGVVVAMKLLEHLGIPDSGGIDVWFRQAVRAGTPLGIQRSGPAEDLWSLTTPEGRVALIARTTRGDEPVLGHLADTTIVEGIE